MHCGLSTAWICGHNRLPRIPPLREGCSLSAQWLRLPTSAEAAVGSTRQTSGRHAFPGWVDPGEPRGAGPRTSHFFGYPHPGLPRRSALGTVHKPAGLCRVSACTDFTKPSVSPGRDCREAGLPRPSLGVGVDSPLTRRPGSRDHPLQNYVLLLHSAAPQSY